MFFKKRKEIVNVKHELITVLESLINLLENTEFETQRCVVQYLLSDLENDKIDSFKKRIRSVEMWGGSGAVWEILIKDKKVMKKFDTEIIKLIDIMDLLGWRSWRMKGIKNLISEKA